MKQLFLSLLFFSFLTSVFGQNLVVNPSFETFSSCPTTASQINFATPWQTAKNSPEYLNVCSTSIYADVPTNYFGFENAATGNAYMGALFYGSFAGSYLADLREFMYGNLTTPLTAGLTYYVSFKANLVDNSDHAVNNLGVQFTNTYNSNFPLNNMAHVYTTGIVSNKTGWTQITGSFVPSVSYTNLMVGNFFTDVNTAVTTSATSTSIGYNAYYFIDDVCVSVVPGVCFTALPVEYQNIDVKPIEHQYAQIHWTTLSEQDAHHYELERSFDGETFEHIASIPAQNTASEYTYQDEPKFYNKPIFYKTRLIDKDGNTFTSKTVETILSPDTHSFNVYPNPVALGEEIKVQAQLGNQTQVQIQVLNMIGQSVWQTDNTYDTGFHTINIPTQNLERGTYIVLVRTNKGTTQRKIVVM